MINSAEINPSPAIDTDNLSIDWVEFDADGDNYPLVALMVC